MSSFFGSPLHSDLELKRKDSRPSSTDVSEEELADVDHNLAMSAETASHNLAHRFAFENLRKRQYWRPDWRGNVDLHRPFSIADPSTLGRVHYLCPRVAI